MAQHDRVTPYSLLAPTSTSNASIFPRHQKRSTLRLIMMYESFAHQLREWAAMPPHDNSNLMQDTRWADGLRGIASLFVVSSHLTLCFARRIIVPCCAEGSETPTLWQLPPFRLVGMGHSWVAMFFILLGFVNALKPLKLARQYKLDAALSNLSQSSFRRTFRLMLPATAATVISWFICQLGLYTTAHRGDAYWMLAYTPWPSDTWWEAIKDLLKGLQATWLFWSDNPYDQPQWALIHLLYGSMVVFTTLLMTLTMAPRWRAAALAVIGLWSLDWSKNLHDPIVPVTVLSGILLAELFLSSIPLTLSTFSPLLSPLLLCMGLFFMCLPSEFTDKAVWSDWLQNIGQSLFPSSAQNELNRTWGSIGASMLVLSVLLSPHLRRLLSLPTLTWLGKVSFPIYLLHGMFIRTVLAWLAFQSEPKEFETDHGPELRYPQRSAPALWLAICISMGTMLLASHYWTMNVEPLFGKITAVVEKELIGRREEVENGTMVLPVRKD